MLSYTGRLFQLFSSENCFPKVCWTWSEQVKNDHFEKGVDGFFSDFSLLFYFLTRIIPGYRCLDQVEHE